MEIPQALRLFCQLAHALLPFWDADASLQEAVHQRIAQWSKLKQTEAEFFDLVMHDLAAVGVHDPAIRAAIRKAIDVPVAEHLALMFAQALTVARSIYGERWSGGDNPVFQWIGNREPIHPDQPYYGGFGVGGTTSPGTAAGAAEVELRLAPALLGPPTWAAIPYVLCHELIAHASQAGASSDETDPFSEGWMDELAREVLTERAGELFPWNPVLALDAGQLLCAQLRMLGPPLAERDRVARAARVQGFRAAQLVRGVLDSLAQLSPQHLNGAELFQRLSVELNTVPSQGPHRDLTRHRTFVANILIGGRDAATAARRDAMLRKWVLGEATAAEVLSFM